MEILAISASKKNEKEPELMARLFEAGLSGFHLRKPNYTTKQMMHYLDCIPKQFHNRIIIHSHHELILKYDLRGIHFTDLHLERKFQRWWLLRKIRLSRKKVVMTRSYKKISEVNNEEEMKYDYFLLGTIFNVLSNEFYSGYYEQGILAALKIPHKKFVARGGINEKTIMKAHQLGFTSCALNSYLWKAEDPVQKYLEIVKFCNDSGLKVE